MLPSKVLLVVTKKGPRLPKTMCETDVSEHIKTDVSEKKTVSLVGKMQTWYFFVNSRKNLNWLSFVACVLVQ